jgi:DNA-binding transcriptional ArsR family regulator
MNPEKDKINLAIFKDESFNYLYRKTEKISTALYMITNFFNSNDPLKWDIRKKTVILLNSVMSLSTSTLSGRDQVMREISSNLFHIISLFEIAFRSGFISQMNHDILKKEMEDLGSFLNDFDNKTFFEEKIPKRQEETIRPLIKDTNNIKDNKRQYNVFNNKKTQIMSVKENKIQNNNQERKEKIIEIVKQKGNVSVKDISEQITGVSEKTLQRELLKMVEDGILIKEGERRWSRYSIS